MTEKPARARINAAERAKKTMLVRLLIKLEDIAKRLESIKQVSVPASQ